MNNTWLVRWDTTHERRPAFLRGSDVSHVGPGLTSSVAFRGYLFERGELCVDRPASDSSLVASAYARWQSALFDKLRGGFALAIWDEERRCLVVGRDAMGLIPCFYWWNGRVLVVSPSLDAILSQPDVDARVNRVLVAESVQHLLGSQPVDETYYETIRRLPPAHSFSLREGALSLARYWDPIPPGFAWATEDELSRFTSVLGTAVERCLSVGADSVALSGGFDSVSLAVMAAERHRQGSPLHAVSMRFTDLPCDEGQTQRQVAQALGMPQLMRSLDECLDDDALLEGLLAISRVSPSPVMSMWQPMYDRLLRCAGDLGLSQLIMGTGGDEMFYVNTGYGTDCLAALDLHALWRFCRALQRTWPSSPTSIARYVLWDGAVKAELKRRARSLLGQVSPRTRDLILRRRFRRACPSWFIPFDGDLIGRLERRRIDMRPVEMAPGEGAYVRAMRGLPQSPTFAMELDQTCAWTSQLGFRLLFPYFDRDLVELSLRIPPSQLIAGGRAKAPLRRLVAERLPAVGLPSRKVVFSRLFHTLFRRHGRRAWQALGGPIVLNELGIVDPRGANTMMDTYFDGAGGNGAKAWMMFSTELWLRARTTG